MLASKIGVFAGAKLSLVAAVSSNNVNLFTLFGSPSGVHHVTYVINSGVTIGSTDPANPAINTGSGWATGSTVKIINNGKIYGAGGAGGAGGVASVDAGGTSVVGANGSAGNAGGNAVETSVKLVVDNTNGEIFGGGGGGGGASGTTVGQDDGMGSANFACVGGGGGGGGQGSNTSSGGTGGTADDSYVDNPNEEDPGDNGIAGSSSAAGSGGVGGNTNYIWLGTQNLDGNDGGSGGAWGTSGSSASGSHVGAEYTEGTNGSGGAAGKAVELNGNSITWLGGNNGTQVKGAVS